MLASPLGMPTHAELVDLARQQARLIEVLETQNQALAARIIELEARLKGNSKNSSRPPSSDGLAKPRAKSLRKKTGRRPGGQKGHPGSTKLQVDNPDEVVTHRPVACDGCGQEFDEHDQVAKVQHRQVFELPEIQARVVQHDLCEMVCSCGVKTLAPAPAGVVAPVQYGPRLRAAVLYLYQAQFCSKARTAKACSDLFGVPISSGSVANFQQMADRQLDRFIELVKSQARQAGVLGGDETGVRVAGRTAWLHVARHGLATVLEVHSRRGAAAMEDIGVLPGYAGVLVHDALAGYDKIAPGATHQLCGAHLVRELAAVSEFLASHPEYAQPDGWDWAGQVAWGLQQIKRGCDQAVDGVCPPGVLGPMRHLIVSAGLVAAHSECQPPGVLGAKHRALARRVAGRGDDYLRFATDRAVPFDNNGSERDLRMAKLRMKVSGCFRADTGAQWFARLRSYLSTTGKNGLGPHAALLRIFNYDAWLPAPTT